jgi:hypothetical protein
MNLEEITKRLGITNIDLKRIMSYMEKAEKAEITRLHGRIL